MTVMRRVLTVGPHGCRVETVDVSYPAFRDVIGGGYLQALMADGVTFWFDEEGKFKDLPYNLIATELVFLAGLRLMPGDFIVGIAVLTGPADGSGEVSDVPAEWIDKVRIMVGDRLYVKDEGTEHV